MNKRTTILLHLAVWAILILSPLTFLNHGDGVSLRQFVMTSVSPLTVLLVFYANYYWLTPKLYVTGEKRYYWLVNALLVVGLGVAMHYWMTYTHSLFDDGRHPHHEPTTIDVLVFIIRDIFQLAIAAAIATTIQLAMRWQHSEQARREAEAARIDAELRNLRWQLNPHFLLNTLNNIYALTAIDAQRAQEAIQELSRLMRHVLYDNQQPTVPLSAEVEFMHNYVELMRIRLPKTVDVTFDTPAATLNQPIAPLILISLVENAFKHGVSPTQPSFIHITIEADADSITCDIRNSNHPKTEADRSGHGIGLQQVQHRLDLAYPDAYTWHYGATEDGNEYHSHINIKTKKL